MVTLLKIKNLKTKMTQKMKLLTTTVLLTNGKDTEILLKLDQEMIGIVILVLMIDKKQETMLHHTELMMDGLISATIGTKIKSCQVQ
jgi:hypothetical protein